MLLFNFVYVFLLLCLCVLLLFIFRSRYSVSLCCSVYCFCVNVYCTTATGCQPNCSLHIYIYIYTIYQTTRHNIPTHLSTRSRGAISQNSVILVYINFFFLFHRRYTYVQMTLSYWLWFIDYLKLGDAMEWNGMWKNWDTENLKGTTPIQITLHQKQPKNVE